MRSNTHRQNLYPNRNALDPSFLHVVFYICTYAHMRRYVGKYFIYNTSPFRLLTTAVNFGLDNT